MVEQKATKILHGGIITGKAYKQDKSNKTRGSRQSKDSEDTILQDIQFLFQDSDDSYFNNVSVNEYKFNKKSYAFLFCYVTLLQIMLKKRHFLYYFGNIQVCVCR